MWTVTVNVPVFFCWHDLTVPVSLPSSSTILRILLLQSTVNSLPTILVFKSDPKQQDTLPTASVDVSTTKIIFASYFSRPIFLKNSRNLLFRFQRYIFYSAKLFHVQYLRNKQSMLSLSISFYLEQLEGGGVIF